MSSVENSFVNNVKLAVAVLLLLVGGIGYYWLEGFSDAMRWTFLLGSIVIAGIIFFFTHQGRSFLELLRASKIEVLRVIWPTRAESTQTTIMVVIVVVLTALLLWVLDIMLGFLLSGFLGFGS